MAGADGAGRDLAEAEAEAEAEFETGPTVAVLFDITFGRFSVCE